MLSKLYKGSNIKYERLPKILESDYDEGNTFKKDFQIIKNKNVNKIINGNVNTKILYDNEVSLSTNNLSFYNTDNLNIYNGITNIWLCKNDLFKFPMHYDINKIDIFHCLYGYCLVSRSKTFYNISINSCRDLSWNKITTDSIHTFYEGSVILAKMFHWKKFLPCTILRVNDKIPYGSERSINDVDYFGECNLDIVFSCCPDSDIYVAWHNHNTVVKNKSVISYNKKNFFNDIETVDVVFDDFSSDSDDASLEYSNVSSNVSSNVIVNVIVLEVLENIISQVIDLDTANVSQSIDVNNHVGFNGNDSYGYRNSADGFDDDELIVSGAIDKDFKGKEILKFNTFWLRNNFTTRKISKKAITVSSTEFSNNLSECLLPNVSVLESYHMSNIFKIQDHNRCGCKFFDWEIKYDVAMLNNKLEPQNAEFFKFSPNNVSEFLNRNYGVTYTGPLCDNAKKYLFNIVK